MQKSVGCLSAQGTLQGWLILASGLDSVVIRSTIYI